MSKQQSVGAVNPLLEFVGDGFPVIATWERWRELWDEAQTMEFRHGLLHVGFDLDIGWDDDEYIERILFYIEVADLHGREILCLDGADELDFWNESQWRLYSPLGKTPPKVLAELSKKAYQMLVMKFLKNELTGDSIDRASSIFVMDEVFLERVLWLFRANEYGRVPNVETFRPKVHDKEARWFLLRLCSLIIVDSRKGGFSGLSDDLRERLLKHRPRAIEILSGLGKLRLLLGRNYEHVVFDEEELTKLKELAMDSSLWGFGRIRRVKSVEEAVLAGSEAAEVLVILRIRESERQRLQALKAAEYELQEKKQKEKRPVRF